MQATLWFLIRQYHNGVRTLQAEGLSEEAVDEHIAHFKKINERKPHKIDFFKVPYTSESRNEVLRREISL